EPGGEDAAPAERLGPRQTRLQPDDELEVDRAPPVERQGAGERGAPLAVLAEPGDDEPGDERGELDAAERHEDPVGDGPGQEGPERHRGPEDEDHLRHPSAASASKPRRAGAATGSGGSRAHTSAWTPRAGPRSAATACRTASSPRGRGPSGVSYVRAAASPRASMPRSLCPSCSISAPGAP